MRAVRLRPARDRRRGGAARVAGHGARDDLARVVRWSGQLAGRGACKHPDGAAALLASALRVFADEFARHERMRTCVQVDRPRWAA